MNYVSTAFIQVSKPVGFSFIKVTRNVLWKFIQSAMLDYSIAGNVFRE